MIAKITQKHIKVCYAISNKMAALKTAKLSSRVKQKQSVQDVHNLQDFLTTQISENKLTQTIKRTSKYDDGFAEFLSEYKKKNKNILDLTHYATSPLNKSNSLREEEYRELKAFLDQRKQQYKMLFQDEEDDAETLEDEQNLQDEGKENESDEETNEPIIQDEEGPMINRTGFEIDDTFYTILLDRDTNTQVTTLQRINTFRQLVFMGNGNGIIGYGQGKGKDFESAFRRAMSDAKRNLVPISLDLWLTCPVKLEGKFYDTEIEITPRPLGFNSYGNPQLASMILLSGIHHCGFKARSRNQRPYALLYAYMQAITSNVSPDEISEAFGCKVYRQNWGKKISRLTPLTLGGI